MVLQYISLPLVLFALFPLVLGSITSAQCAEAVRDWYPTLRKPSWVPPTPLFGQIWSVLYLLLGLGAFVAWTEVGFSQPLYLWLGHLLLNLAWMFIFYKQKNMKLAQIDNLVVLGSGYYLARVFHKIKPVAGWLLAPYVAFLVFANALNLAFIRLNSGPENAGLYDNLHDKKNPGEAGYGPTAGTTGSYSPGGATPPPGTVRPGALRRGAGPPGVPASPLARPALAPGRARTSIPRPAARFVPAAAARTTLKALL